MWVFPIPDLKGLRTAEASWPQHGTGWIVDAAIPAAALLKRTGLKKFQPMTLRGDFLRYKQVPRAGSAKRDLLSLTWSPIILGIPHRCPAAFGYLELTAEGR